MFIADPVVSSHAALAAALALFWVSCVWDFWSRGIHALGLNAAVFLAGVLWLVRQTNRAGCPAPRIWPWAIPFGLIASSFAIHDNSYVKSVSLALFPIGLCVACVLGRRSTRVTFLYLFAAILRAIEGPLRHLELALGNHLKLTRMIPWRNPFAGNALAGRVLIGSGLSLVVIGCVVVPLLATADDEFARRMQAILTSATRPLVDMLGTGVIWRALVFAVLSVALLAYAQSAAEPYRPDEPVELRRQDSVIAGILLTGVTAVYVLFLWVQLERFWLGTLPQDFETTARLVKSGFWQMIALTAFNLVLHILYYRRTAAPVQRALLAFCVASTLLLGSAAHRVYLYVSIYGLSHEKFFACYAVVYCGFLFALFVWLFALGRDADVIRIAAFTGLWVFALTAVLPTERWMFALNLELSRCEASRINVDQMELFGTDVYPLVMEHAMEISEKEYFKLDERSRRSRIWLVSGLDRATPWDRWRRSIERRIDEQRWYERSISSQEARQTRRAQSTSTI